MTIYQDSKRFVGTAEDREGSSAISGGWKELARTTLGSGNTNINVASIPDKRYYMILRNTLGRGGGHGTNGGYIINNDSGSNYAVSRSGNGGNWADNANFSDLDLWDANSPQILGVDYMVNKSDKEKLLIGYVNDGNTAGAGNVPMRAKIAGKWANTSDAINRIDLDTMNSTTWNSGSEVVVLGWDPDDTHTTNFWEQLGSSSTVTSNAIDVSLSAEKKYLWVQGYLKQGSGTSGSLRMRVGNSSVDTGSNYVERFSENGGTDDTSRTSQTALKAVVSDGAGSAIYQIFFNLFIINNASKEKLIIGHAVHNNGATGAGTWAARIESVSKWTNTSDQIDVMKFYRTNDTLDSGLIKVWGSN